MHTGQECAVLARRLAVSRRSMARLTFGAAKQAAGASILINGAARRTALGNLIEAISERNPRAGMGVTRGLRDESGGVSDCSTGCDRESDRNVERRLT